MRNRCLALLCLFLLALSPAHADDLLSRPAGSGNAMLGATASSFLPVAQAYPLRASIRDGQFLLQWNITPGYYLYRERMQLRLIEAAGARLLDVQWPPGEAHEDAYLGATQVYRGPLEVALPLASGTAHELELKSQGCADAGLCYPPRTQRFALDPESGAVTEIIAPPPPRTAIPGAPVSAVAAPAALAYMALLAALGGMLLNLMPCVFPVLSLKVLGIAAKGGDSGGKLTHGLAYTVGVVLSFVVVAAALLALRQAGAAIGWGFHLQSPVFVAALAYLFVAMGLGLSGVVNLGAGVMGSGSALAAKGGYSGTFFTGVLATVVASPCSAPFMGTALGFAMTQPPASALTVFAALGLGMAIPFLALTMSPRLLALLPRPGPWMEEFKQLLAFPLYAAGVWLFWVLGKQSGVNGMAIALGGAVLMGLGLWAWERSRSRQRPLRMRLVSGVAMLLALLLLGSPWLRQQAGSVPAGSGANWERYSPARLDELRRAGTPVFVNITADWCITCLANEKIALDTSAVRSAFTVAGVVYLKGDWTNADPELTAFLQSHGRSGVPLYLYYPGAMGALPVILPQLLTPNLVLEALATP